MSPTVRSVHVALPSAFVAPDGREMTSAIRKRPVAGSVRVLADRLEGDGTAFSSHGGEHMHVHVFSGDDYAPYEARLGRALPVPAVGANHTGGGLDARAPRGGDEVRIGTARFRVTQPTVRCKNVGRSLGIPQMLEWAEELLLTGFYVSVVEQGALAAGDTWHLLARGREDLTIARLNHAMFRQRTDSALMDALLADPDLPADWKGSLSRRRTRGR